MFCKHCGALLADDEICCPKCGNKVSEENETDENRIRSLVCDSCGSTNFKRIGKGEYVCNHCGRIYVMDQDDATYKEPDADARLYAIFDEAAKYEALDKYKKELEVLSKGLEIAPDNCTLLTKLGRVYWRLGMFKWAKEYLDKAEMLYPDDPVVYNNIALLYLSKDLYSEAIPYFEKSMSRVEADPISAGTGDTATIYGNYALCVGLLGELDEARKYLKIAKEKGYPNSSIKNVCKRLNFDSRSI